MWSRGLYLCPSIHVALWRAEKGNYSPRPLWSVIRSALPPPAYIVLFTSSGGGREVRLTLALLHIFILEKKRYRDISKDTLPDRRLNTKITDTLDHPYYHSLAQVLVSAASDVINRRPAFPDN